MTMNMDHEKKTRGFARLENAVENILNLAEPLVVVVKVPRAGLTTSLCKVCEKAKRTLCVVEPTNKILSQTLPQVARAADIKANSFCEINRRMVERYPILKNLPMHLPQDCDNCEEKDGCAVYVPINVENPERISITYAKLEAVLLSPKGGQDGRENIEQTV
jgi:hypothetical protein